MTAKLKTISKLNLIILFVATILLAQLVPALISKAFAANMGDVTVRFDNMNTSSTTTGYVCIKPGSIASTVASVAVTFPPGFTVSTTLANWATSVTNTGWPTTFGTPQAWPTIGAAASSVSGQTVTFSSGNLTSTTTLYCFDWTNAAALTQPAAAGSTEPGNVVTQTSAPATIDTGNYATQTVTNDQVVVTGTVVPTFSVTYNNNADALGSLSSTSPVASSTSTFTVGTNSSRGWSAWVKDTNSGLASASQAHTISSTTTPGIGVAAAALTAGNEGMNLGVSVTNAGTGAGTPAVSPNFAGSTTNFTGGSFNNAGFQQIITDSGTTAGLVVTPTNNVSISAATPPATDYTDTETFVAAGNF
jgi:hypothetical protein